MRIAGFVCALIAFAWIGLAAAKLAGAPLSGGSFFRISVGAWLGFVTSLSIWLVGRSHRKDKAR